MHGGSPRTTPNLRKMDQGSKIRVEAKDFAKHVKSIHEEMREHITKMNMQNETKAYQKRTHKEFQVGDQVMVYLTKSSCQ